MLQAILVVLVAVFLSTIALAETVSVPRLSDGTVDVGAVMSSFQAVLPMTTDGASNEVTGSFLGSEFRATVSTSTNETSNLRILSKELSEEAVFMAAVLLADMICINQGLRSSPMNWKETAVELDGGWSVPINCVAKPGAAKG